MLRNRPTSKAQLKPVSRVNRSHFWRKEKTESEQRAAVIPRRSLTEGGETAKRLRYRYVQCYLSFNNLIMWSRFNTGYAQ